MSKLDNTQAELDEILDEITSFDVYKHPEYIEEAKQAILDWHNKQIEAALDRLEDGLVAERMRLNAERNKLKEK